MDGGSQRWRFAVPFAAVLLAGGGGSAGCRDDDPDASPSSTTSSSAGTTSGSEMTGTASTTDGAADTTTGGAVDDDAIARYCGDDSAAIEERITEVLAALDVPEKVAMMHGVGLLPTGGAWPVAGNEPQGIPGLHMLDGPRGVSKVSGETATVFPVGMMRGATWDPALEREVGAAMGREIRSVGADVLLAPTMNLLRHPRWGRAQETYGEDTVHVGTMAVGFIDGVQSERVIATAKHFAANSIEDTRFDVDVTLDDRTLHEVYLPHFRRAVQDANVGAVMSAYNSVNGLHCDVNPTLLRDILRGQWGFAGFVMSDWVQGTHGSVEAVRAGLDVEMPSGAHFHRLADAVADGDIGEDELDASLRGILRAQLCFGLDVDPPQVDPAARETDEHLALAEEVARRGLVLLTNDGVLPLDRAALGEIIVMGPLADLENLGDAGSSAAEAAGVVTALEGLVDRAGAVTVTYLPSAMPSPEDELAIAAADVVVLVVGLTADDEGEGLIAAGDREDLSLPAAQLELVNAVAALGTPTVVVLEGGGPILVTPWIDGVAAVMMAWYPGMRGGNAIADVLFGDAEPSGRLPASVPVAEADLPPFDNVSLAVTYDYLHGYRWLDANGTAPAFPFGFGLSYTAFTYDAIALSGQSEGTVSTIVATVEVTNTGPRRGRETVQVYVESPDGIAPRDLRGFASIELDPGESGSVDVAFPLTDLATYDAGTWTITPGQYLVHAGPNAGELPLSAEYDVTPGE